MGVGPDGHDLHLSSSPSGQILLNGHDILGEAAMLVLPPFPPLQSVNNPQGTARVHSFQANIMTQP